MAANNGGELCEGDGIHDNDCPRSVAAGAYTSFFRSESGQVRYGLILWMWIVADTYSAVYGASSLGLCSRSEREGSAGRYCGVACQSADTPG